MNLHRSLYIVCIIFQIFTAQPFIPLYLPDSLGGCADFNEFIYNPVMNEVYVWSARSGTLGILDARTAERKRPWHISGNIFAHNPNNNRLYVTTTYRASREDDTFAIVYDCSTRAVIDSLIIPNRGQLKSRGMSVNLPANKIFWYAGWDDLDVTFIFDAVTNEFRGKIDKGPFIHHPLRPVAYVCETYPSMEDPFLYVLDVENGSIVDTILPPLDCAYHQPLLVASAEERLFAPACVPKTPRLDRLQVINCLNNQLLGEVQLPGEVWDMAYNPINNKLYVACELPWPRDRTAYVIDVASIQLTDSFDIPLIPNPKLFYNPNTNHLYVPAYGPGRGICVFDGATNQLITEIFSPRGDGIMVPQTNRLFLNNRGFNIVLIDCDQLRLERFFKMGFINQNLMWQPITNRLYINDTGRDSMSSILVVYDAHTLQPLKVLDFCGKVKTGEWFYDLTTATEENKIYLTSGQRQGIYVLDGATDSLLDLISCDAGGHQLIYSKKANRLFACPFTDDGYLYVIDCATDQIINMMELYISDGYLNPFNELLYLTTGTEPSYLYVVDTNGTALRKIRGLGNPLAFRNKEETHQVYIACHNDTCIYVFDPLIDSILDTVPDVPVYNRSFSYYDSTDDRLYYPTFIDNGVGIIVIDCATNKVMDTIELAKPSEGVDVQFVESAFWNPVSNRLYFSHWIVDCHTNRVIDTIPILEPSRTAWNYYDNIVFVNDHWRAKVVAVADDLIGIQEVTSGGGRGNTAMLLSPSVGKQFALLQRPDGDLRLIDIAGRVVGKVSGTQSVIDARSFAPGVYFAMVQTQGRVELVQKFVVVK